MAKNEDRLDGRRVFIRHIRTDDRCQEHSSSCGQSAECFDAQYAPHAHVSPPISQRDAISRTCDDSADSKLCANSTT